MPSTNSAPEPTPEESMLIQAIESIRNGEYAQARDILTKLIKTDQHNPEYWVWLSAAMETPRERLYCLQTANTLDPTNAAARRGLLLMGELTSDAPLQPFPMNHPRPWEARLKQAENLKKPKKAATPGARMAIVVGVLILAVFGVLIGVGIKLRGAAVTPETAQSTARPTVTPYATISSASNPATATSRPLAELLLTPYTPTPIYAATPHGDLAGDSYKGALRAYKNGQWELMGLMMAQVATAQPGSADALYFIGESYRLASNYQDAVDYYNSAIAVNPNFAPSYLGRALANMASSPQKNVLGDLDQAVLLDPRYAEAFMQRGLYYLSRHDPKAAMADLEQAASINDSPLVELNRARILLEQGDTAAAIETAKRANEMDVTMLDGYLVLGMAYRANGQIEQAVDVLETYLKYSPDNPQAMAWLGAAYYTRGDYAQAEDSLAKSLRLDKNNSDAYFWLGQTYLALKQYDKAQTNYLRARDLDPDSFDKTEGLARVYIAQGEYNNSYIAIIKVEKSAVTPEQRARFIYIRALSLEQLSQPDAAYRDWNELLKMPAGAATEEMLATAHQHLVDLRTPTPTITLTPTITPTPTITATALGGVKLPRPTDTRVPTRTPKGTPAPTATPTP